MIEKVKYFFLICIAHFFEAAVYNIIKFES